MPLRPRPCQWASRAPRTDHRPYTVDCADSATRPAQRLALDARRGRIGGHLFQRRDHTFRVAREQLMQVLAHPPGALRMGFAPQRIGRIPPVFARMNDVQPERRGRKRRLHVRLQCRRPIGQGDLIPDHGTLPLGDPLGAALARDRFPRQGRALRLGRTWAGGGTASRMRAATTASAVRR